MKPGYNYDATPVAQAVHAYAVPNAPQAAAPVAAESVFRNPINEIGARAFLSSKHWPTGLQDTFLASISKIPIRFFICDNSGSMVTNDGKKIVNGRQVACSRWAELSEALQFHVDLSLHSNCISEFRLLNGAPPIIVSAQDGHSQMTALLAESPSGGTPLCRHIGEIIVKIRGMEASLRAAGQKACVVIATDGESSDGDIAAAMRPLEQLPVWVVVRLCTDGPIVNYWNNIDAQLELEMDVLDDIFGEAAEVNENNYWLVYGEPLHRMREFGVPIKEFDLLDEGKLSPEQMRKFCHSVLGGPLASYPDPLHDFSAFRRFIQEKVSKEGKIFDPITRSMQPWFHVKWIAHAYGPSTCSMM